ncbi:MAG: formyltetrahydrofolate deformylase [Thermodesulfobacteriota bacterium]
MKKGDKKKRLAILLVHCPDRKGLVASITEFIYKNDGNITYLDQHVDEEKKVFFMRVVWELDLFKIPAGEIEDQFHEAIAKKADMKWKLYFSDEIPRMAVFVSKQSHCLYDLLSSAQSEEWNVEIPLIISNHPGLEHVAKKFGIDFHCIQKSRENKLEAEAQELALLNEYDIDFIVLARYMQILSTRFVESFSDRIINIHHSFLPAFPGARPYHSAYERGVKIIGASCHFVTPALDAGPIIEQDVVRVSHQNSVKDLIRMGRELEKVVLTRSVWLYLQRKLLVYENRTIVFV